MRMHLVSLVLLAACSSGGSGEEFVFDHADGQLKTTFRSSGAVSVTQESLAWQVDLQTTGFGRTESGVSHVAQVSPVKGPNGRAIYDRTVFTEWYENRSDGLKQGFDIPAAPAGDGDLVVQMTVAAGLLPVLQGDGQAVNFMDKSGKVRMMYDALAVYDADGDELESWMELACTRECTLSLVVDDAGADYPIQIDPRVWAGTQEIAAPNQSPGQTSDRRFGASVAIDGTWAVVGSPGYRISGVNNIGRAYVYEFASGAWALRATLNAQVPGPTSDAFANSAFGEAVDIDVATGTILVGAPDAGGPSTTPGAAYVYTGSGTTWTIQAKLTPPGTTATNDQFGASVAVDGDWAVVGAPLNDAVRDEHGAAYVFQRTSGSWNSGATLDTDGPADDLDINNNDQVGFAVALDGDRAVVGARLRDHADISPNNDNAGAVLVYERDGTDWDFQVQLRAETAAAQQRFGSAVSLDGDTLAVGAPAVENGTNGEGSAYVLSGSGTSWDEDAILTAPTTTTPSVTPHDGMAFGASVAVHGAGVAVGAPWYDAVPSDPPTSTASHVHGAAFVFELQGAGWVHEQSFLNGGTSQHYFVTGTPGSNGNDRDQYGASIALNGDRLMVGDPLHDSTNTNRGSVFAYIGTETDEDGDGYFLCDSIFPHLPSGCDCDDEDEDVRPGPFGLSPTPVEDGTNVGQDVNCDNFDSPCGSLAVVGSCDPRVLITEVMLNPGDGVSSPDGQWIEILNRSTHDIDLRGANLARFSTGGDAEYRIDEFLVVGPSERVVIGGNDDPLANGGISVDHSFEGSSFSFVNGTSTLAFRAFSGDLTQGGPEMDDVEITANFSTGTALPQGASLSLDPDFTFAGAGNLIKAQNDVETRWCDGRTAFGDGQLGTPGDSNDECDYAFEFTYTYSDLVGPPFATPASGTTVVYFDHDDTERWFTTENQGEGSFTRTTSDANGGALIAFTYEYFPSGTGPTYEGTQIFGTDCPTTGSMSGIPSPYTAGAWAVALVPTEPFVVNDSGCYVPL